MKTNNSFEDKSLEELKATKAKYQKILVIFAVFMTVAMSIIVWAAIKTKNWGQLGTLGIIGTFVPLFINIDSIDKEIKRREQSN